MGTDTQPNALFIAVFILLATKEKVVNAPIILLWLCFLMGVALYFKNNLSLFLYLKNTLNYLSPALVCTTTYLILIKYKKSISFNLFLAIIGIYGLVGLVQLYIDPSFLSSLVNQQRGVLVNGRGVVSISTEPAYYGTICLFFMIFSFLNFDKKQNYLAQSILIFQLVFLSRSATAIATIAVALILFIGIQILRLKWRYLLTSIMFVLLIGPMVYQSWNQLSETRTGEIAQTFITNPLLLTQIDGSIAVRFTSTVAPFLSLRHDYGAPQGLGYFSEFLSGFYTNGQYRSFIPIHSIADKPRISGCINLVLFQLGLLGMVFPVAIFLAFKNILKYDRVKFSFILFFVLLFTQIQLMHGMIGFVIGTACYLSKQERLRS